MQLGDELHDGVTGVLVDKAGHGCVFQVLQFVAQMDRVGHLGVADSDSLLEFDFLAEEFSEIGLLRQVDIELVGLVVVVVAAVAARVAIWRRG